MFDVGVVNSYNWSWHCT